MNKMQLQMDQIGVIHSPYKEKFAVPRQPGLVTAAHGELELHPPYDHPDCVRGLAQFSHVWLIFAFHETMDRGWKAMVRPPRLGGNERIGVFATRSTFRPNPLGLSVAKLVDIETRGNKTVLKLDGIDLVDGTPILDIKPYVPYADSLEEAQAGYAHSEPDSTMQVEFGSAALAQLTEYADSYPDFQALITQVLQQDPRPAYKKNTPEKQEYGVNLYDFNVRWTVEGDISTVVEISPND